MYARTRHGNIPRLVPLPHDLLPRSDYACPRVDDSRNRTDSRAGSPPNMSPFPVLSNTDKRKKMADHVVVYWQGRGLVITLPRPTSKFSRPNLVNNEHLLMRYDGATLARGWGHGPFRPAPVSASGTSRLNVWQCLTVTLSPPPDISMNLLDMSDLLFKDSLSS